MWARRTAWRAGYDLHDQQRGGARMPVRLRRVRPIGPLAAHRRSIPSQFDVAVDAMTSFVGFGFGADGWNPLVATLREYEADESLTYEDSAMARTHERFQPATLAEVIVDGDGEAVAPLDRLGPDRRFYRYLWEVSTGQLRTALAAERRATPSYYFGPLDPERGRAEFARLVEAYRSIRDQGYQPERFGPITGYLIGDEDRHRFVIGSGNHRAAALAALGIDRGRVALHSHVAVVHRSQLEWWTEARGGPYPTATAHALFDRFVLDGGADRADRFGLR